jgi:hypothetical protein
LATWAAALAVAIGSGYFGQQGVGQLQHYIENFNGEWLANWTHSRSDPSHSKTALGAVGRLKQSGRIVIRIKADANTPALLLREASYYQYKGETWYAEPSGQGFEPVHEEVTNKDSYVLSPGKANLPNLNIACYLSGGDALLPLPPGCTRLDNCPVFSLAKNRLGAVLASGPGKFLKSGGTRASSANTCCGPSSLFWHFCFTKSYAAANAGTPGRLVTPWPWNGRAWTPNFISSKSSSSRAVSRGAPARHSPFGCNASPPNPIWRNSAACFNAFCGFTTVIASIRWVFLPKAAKN